MSTVVSEDRIRKMTESVGGLEAIAEGERRFRDDQRFLEDNRDRFRAEYPDKWIGILNRRVAAHGDTADDVLEALLDAHEDISGAVLHHACIEDSVWLLAEWSR